VRDTIRPALAAGRDVICDRFIDSSYAYQGAGKGIAERDIAQLERFVLDDLKPDLTLVLDLDPEVGLARTAARGTQNRFEAEALAVQRRVRAAFLERARLDPRRCVVVDAAADATSVKTRIETILAERL
jgi:dTMP kinase